MPRFFRVGLWGVALFLLIACTSSPRADPTSEAVSLYIAAAADLQFAFREIGALYEKETGVRVTFVFGSSGQLAQQIENGAPYDAFASANIAYVDRLREKGLIVPETQQLYAQGRIVLATRRDSSIRLERLEDLLQPAVRQVAIANPEHAPYGLAGKQALEARGLWEAVKPKLVYGENVSQALQFVQTGNAEAGIIALSVANAPDITYTLIDASLHKPLSQAMAVLKRTAHPQEAEAFLEFVNGPQGRTIMKQYGFLLPGEF